MKQNLKGSLRLSPEGPVLKEGMTVLYWQVAKKDIVPVYHTEKTQLPPAPPKGPAWTRRHKPLRARLCPSGFPLLRV